MDEAMAATWGIEFEEHRAFQLEKLASHLSRPLLIKALAANWKIGDVEMRAQVLAGLVAYLSDLQREAMATAALAAVQQVEDLLKRVSFLTNLIPHLPEELALEWLPFGREIGSAT
ncbi:MAG: hypothetical protein P8129_25700, partial [Anaerolineae bacterium]